MTVETAEKARKLLFKIKSIEGTISSWEMVHASDKVTSISINNYSKNVEHVNSDRIRRCVLSDMKSKLCELRKELEAL